ncbi:MAG: polyisoprenoid-binding protein [Calditrichaeota bacterium]|nr:polyisoprenoid-binding protein [Calditrichota bacterium]MCB9369930.1 polyisoprenoid-binding protein [Calditrichota bacterium]
MKMIQLLVLALVVAGSTAFAADWNIDKAHSSINFSTKHMLVSTVHGKFEDFDGTVSFDPKDLSTISTNFTVQMASVNTDNEKRDGHLKTGDFFDVEHFPTMTFVSKKAEQTGEGKAMLTGDLTIRGVTKEVTFDVEGFNQEVKSPWGTFNTGGTATTTINRFDYGVAWDTKLDSGGLVVGQDVNITVELELNRPAE